MISLFWSTNHIFVNLIPLKWNKNTILFEFKGWHKFDKNFVNLNKHVYKPIYVGKKLYNL